MYCTTSTRLRELRNDVPPEQVSFPWSGYRKTEHLADGRGSLSTGAVSDNSTNALGLGLTPTDAQIHHADVEKNLQKANDLLAAAQEQLAEAEKRVMLAKEGLYMMSLDYQNASRVLGQFRGLQSYVYGTCSLI
ncbi:hypothetical protein MMC08_005069 [Hypocenomyce scalaris]|nr:hypothetical protein [Hypocenomyce scalaris]